VLTLAAEIHMPRRVYQVDQGGLQESQPSPGKARKHLAQTIHGPGLPVRFLAVQMVSVRHYHQASGTVWTCAKVSGLIAESRQAVAHLAQLCSA